MNIAFAGKMTAGKTISAEYLTEHYGFKRLRFAAPMYEIMDLYMDVYHDGDYDKFVNDMADVISSVFPRGSTEFNHAHKRLTQDLYQEYLPVGSTMEFKDSNYRSLIQNMGTREMRGTRPSVWVDYMVNTIKESPDKYLVVDDCRFLDEYTALKELGFVMVRLQISPDVQVKRLTKIYGSFDPETIKHPSELQLDNVPFDHYVDADTPLDIMISEIEARLKIKEVLKWPLQS